ncbi:MAG: hypothetical protein IJT48_08610, partial [Bacteroidaceae bacterium]|nr:hypothetical protein [Bacteroidaceae bacterium]
LPTDERDWQMMFLGKMAGKSSQKGMGLQPIVVRDDENERSLVNLEMVRIKRRGERHEGLEVFVQGGKYGVMKDGVVTCRPEFVHISRLKKSRYYAIATYPYAVYKGKSTVIGLSGEDLRVALYGRVTPRGELMEGEDATGHRTFWDGVGGQYFTIMPDFEDVGGVQMVCLNGKYLPRQGGHLLKGPVERKDIWYNDNILWMDRVVIVKKTGEVYLVAAFGEHCFYVKSGMGYQDGVLKVRFDGDIVSMSSFNYRWEMRQEEKKGWRWNRLVRASTGQMEYFCRR